MKKIVCLFLIILVFVGCYKDQSSTRHEPIGSILINAMEDVYNLISFEDVLVIEPVVTSTDPNDDVDNFEFLWTFYRGDAFRYPPPTIDTIARTKNLSWPIMLAPDRYTLSLQVTNPANGYTVFRSATLHVGTVFLSGFYLLKELNGNTELDFHSSDGAGNWSSAFNLLQTLHGTPIIGQPTSLGITRSGTGAAPFAWVDPETGEGREGKVLVIMGGNDVRIVRLEDMMPIFYNYSSLFFAGAEPAHRPLRFFNNGLFFGPPGTSFHSLITEGGFYSLAGRTGNAGVSIAPPGGVSLTGGIRSIGAFPYLVFFDELHGRLVYFCSQANNVISLGSANGISPNNITHRLLFMGTNASGTNEGWSIFKDATDPSRRYLYNLNFSRSGALLAANAPILEIRRINAALAPNFNNANIYGANRMASNILYGAVDDRLYMFNTGNNTERRLSPRGMGAGETITMITHRLGIHNPNNFSDDGFNSVVWNGMLIIATYKNGNYAVYMYQLAGGIPNGEPLAILRGQGRVVDMQYNFAGNWPLAWHYDVNL